MLALLTGALAWLRRVVPTLLVLAGLGGLAAWGHHTGWKVPHFSALMGEGQTEDKDWCEEHHVPEVLCVECKPDLMPRTKDAAWCATHGVPECPLDHPELAEVTGQPKLPRYDVQSALHLLDRPENNQRCKLHLRRLQFASAESARKAGVGVYPVEEAPMVEFVAASGEITFDQTRVARLSARVPGTAWRVDKKIGDAVTAGEVLALIDAAEVGRAKGEFLQSLVQFRLKDQNLTNYLNLTAKGAIPDRQVRETEAARSEARIRLLGAHQALVNLGLPVAWEELQGLTEDQLAARIQFLGLPAAVRDRLDPKRTTASLIPVKASQDGVIVSREVVAGEVVDAAKALFVVADPQRLWLTLHVRLEDVNHLRVGQAVKFQPDGGAPEARGVVAWISPAADEKTRTVKVRADLPNPEGRLRAHTFGAGRIVLREEAHAVVVPREALHWDGDCHVVFVRDKHFSPQNAASPLVFHVRKVRPGAKDERHVELLAGVLPGEVVASKGSAVLRAELLKGNMGEG